MNLKNTIESAIEWIESGGICLDGSNDYCRLSNENCLKLVKDKLEGWSFDELSLSRLSWEYWNNNPVLVFTEYGLGSRFN